MFNFFGSNPSVPVLDSSEPIDGDGGSNEEAEDSTSNESAPTLGKDADGRYKFPIATAVARGSGTSSLVG
jgi:hypothetical protein